MGIDTGVSMKQGRGMGTLRFFQNITLVLSLINRGIAIGFEREKQLDVIKFALLLFQVRLRRLSYFLPSSSTS